uniref:Ig-like domain-containing protein n=1 Tax=Schistosoma curassoni TaxID=6186 RepID=A0A183KDM4_9TREM
MVSWPTGWTTNCGGPDESIPSMLTELRIGSDLTLICFDTRRYTSGYLLIKSLTRYNRW